MEKHKINPVLLEAIRTEIVQPFNDIVQWDRWSVNEPTDSGFIYGWIKRDDGANDFVIFQFWLHNGNLFTKNFNTSSAKYSKIIAARMNLTGAQHPYLECWSCSEIEGANLIDWQKPMNRRRTMSVKYLENIQNP